MAESTATLRQEIKALSGVDIMLNETTFKSTYDIMDELSKKWEDLSDIAQATIIELVAGKHQGNVFSSLMANFDIAQDALNTSLNSSGSAMAEHAKWSESLEARLNKLKATWQSFAQSFMKTGALKVGIETLKSLVQTLEWLIDNFGILGTSSLGIIGKSIFNYFKGAKDVKESIEDTAKATEHLTDTIEDNIAATNASTEANNVNVDSEAAEIEANTASTTAEEAETKANLASTTSEVAESESNIVSATTEVGEAEANLASTTTELAEAEANVVSTTTELAEAEANVVSTTTETAEATANVASVASETAEATANLASSTTEAGKAAANASGGFAKFFGTFGGKVAIIAAVVAVIGLAYNQFKKAKEKAAELRQETINASNEFLDAANSFEKAYIKYSGKTNLTSEEESELTVAINGTIDALGDKSGALQGVINSNNDYITSLEQIARAELKAANKKAQDKLEAAETELDEVSKGWVNFDGSEVNVKVASGVTPDTEETAKVAKEIAEKYNEEFYDILSSSGSGTTSAVGFELSTDADIEEIVNYYNMLVEYQGKLDELGLKDTTAYNNTTEAIGKMSEAVNTYIDALSDASKLEYQYTENNGIPKTLDEYLKMRESILTSDDIKKLSIDAKRTIANTLDSDYKISFNLSDIKAQARSLVGIIDEYGDAEVSEMETFLNMRTMVNNNECTVGEYLSQFDRIDKMTADWSEGAKNELNTSFALDTDAIKQQYKDTYDYLSRFYKNQDVRNMDRDEAYDYKFKARENDKKVEEFLNSLTAEELAAVISIRTEIDWENTSAKDIRKQIQEQVDINEALAFEASIEVDTTALEAFNTVLTESASAIGLSEESIDSLKSKYKDLDSYSPHTLFEATTNGVKVNREELAKLEKEYNELKKTKVKEHLDTLVGAYNDVTAEIDKCTNASERERLVAEREGYSKKIEELATYQAQLEGVTGAYQRWVDAQSGPEDYDGYESIATSYKDIKDEINRGFISNKSKEFIDLLSGKDLVGGSIDDYYNAWKKLDDEVTSSGHSIKDFFTVNDDGEITSTGIDRFFEDVRKDFGDEVYKLNEETGEYYYDFSSKNLETIQKEWGIGIDAIGVLLESAAAAGYNVDWDGIFDNLDLDTSNFESLVSVAESAQKELNKLKGYEDLDFNFTTTNVEEATSELEEAQRVYNEIVTDDNGDIDINAKGADKARIVLSTLLVQKQQLEDSEIAINISTSGLDESQSKAVAWVQDFRTKYKNLEIAISTGEGIEEAKEDLEGVKTSLVELDGDTAKIAAQLVLGEDTNTSGDGFKMQVNNAIKAIGEQNIDVGFKLNETSIGGLNSNLLTNFTVDATAKITEVDKSQLEKVETGGMVTWEENTDGVTKKFDAKGTVNWDDNIKNVKTSFSANGTVRWTSGNNVKVKVISEVDGTANANGTTQPYRSFARGDWGIKGNGTALVGELGMETLVRGGRFYTIGDNGAEFIKYKQGDIIFNHKQTEELFKNGKVTSDGGRGKMFANGSAFADGSYPSSGRAFAQATVSDSLFVSAKEYYEKLKKEEEEAARKQKILKEQQKKQLENLKKIQAENSKSRSSGATAANSGGANGGAGADVTGSGFGDEKTVKPSGSGSGSGGGGGGGSSEKTKEVLDWIEVAISRIEREIDRLDKKANSVYKSWSSRNEALVDEIDKVGDEIELQQSAYDRYIKEANSVGLSSSWASKVRNGEVDIDTITDEKLKEKISSYKEWYEKALACQDAIDELKETESKLYAQRFENIQTQYDSILQGYEHTETMLNEYISQAEERGHIVSKKYYNSLIANEKANIAKLKEEQADLIEMRDEAVDSGKITKGSEEWYKQCAAIDEVTQTIEEGTTSLLEYDNAMREIDWSIFDLIQERIAAVSEEADFLIELMSNDKLFDDDGKLTSQGLATVGLHGQNYNSYMYAADEYGKEVANLNKQIASDPYDQELINRRNELIELQRESILAAEDEKNAIRDLVEEGINLELDALQERIDLHNEELDSMENLYDYQKRVEESSKNIASLRKQLSSYEGDDSEEAKAKIQELKVSLEEAETELQETEYDRYISDQQALLDTLYTEYETILNSRLDNIDYLLEGVIESINAAASADGNIMSALGSDGAIAIAVSNNATSIKDTLASEAKNVGTTLSASMKDIWSVGEGNAKSVLTMYGDGFQKQQTTTNAVLSNIKADVNAMVDDVDKDAKKKTTENKTSTSAKKDPTKTTASTTNKTTTTTKTSTSSGDGNPKVGDKVKFVSGKYYYDSEGKNPAGSKNLGKEVYITSINNKSWATHPYHISTGKKIGSGDLGWLQKWQISGYATGKKNLLDNEVAWTQENGREFIVRPSDGAILTPVAKGDSILTSVASKNIWDMANNPAEFIRDNLNLGSTGAPNNSTVQSNYTQYLDKVIFNMPNVKNYEEFMAALQKDKNFERLVDSMTIKKMTGGSSIAKSKAIR